jgi:hypothetical protein
MPKTWHMEVSSIEYEYPVKIYPMKNIFIICFLMLSANLFSQEEAKPALVDSTAVIAPVKEKPVPPWYVGRLEVSLGLFVPINNTAVTLQARETGNGSRIDFEDDLGYKANVSTAMGGLKWRISKRSVLDFNFYRIDRNSSKRLERTIEFGDNIYEIDTDVYSFFDTDIYRLSYGYAIFLDPKYELGVMVGAHVLSVNLGIGVDGQQVYSDELDFAAPLPNFGIWGSYELSKRWVFSGNLSYLKLKIDNITGRILGYNFQFAYYVTPKFNIALGYTGLNFDVNVLKQRLEGDMEWGYNGPSLSLTYAFGRENWRK